MQETKFQLVDIIAVNDKMMLREAFQSKSGETWELVQIGRGLSKNQRSPKFQLGIVQN